MYNFKSNLTDSIPSGYELTKNVVLRLHEFDISQSAKLVLVYLSTCYNPEKTIVYPKQETIANTLGISIISVKRGIKELLKTGLILKSKTRNQNMYGFQKSIKKIPEKYQKDTSKSIKLIPSLYRTNKEQINKQSESDFSLLESYALKHNAKNIEAYVNKLIKNGDAEQILQQIKAEKTNPTPSVVATQNFLREKAENDKINFSPIDFDRNDAQKWLKSLPPELHGGIMAQEVYKKHGFKMPENIREILIQRGKLPANN